MQIYDITDYGVEGCSALLQTEKIQAIIDLCHQQGGGEVRIPKGIYYIGSLRLYSNMTLHLMEDAHLKGSRNYHDYTDFHVPSTLGYLKDEYFIDAWNLPPYYIYGMICAFCEENISIIGEKGSTIDGQDCFDKGGEEKFRGPMGIIFNQCRNIRMSGYTFENCANWSHQLDSCEDIRADHVCIKAGHDGFNLHHCRNILIEDCTITTGDDCLAGYDIEELIVRNCYMNTACNVMRIGGYNLLFDHCTMEGPARYPHQGKKTYDTHRLFKYYSIRPDSIRHEGEHIIIRNSNITGIPSLIQYQYGEEELMQNNLPLRELILDNSTILGLSKPSVIKGNGEHCRLIFRNCEIGFAQGLNETNYLETDDSVQVISEQVVFI